jgi:hypothetical protein
MNLEQISDRLRDHRLATTANAAEHNPGHKRTPERAYRAPVLFVLR